MNEITSLAQKLLHIPSKGIEFAKSGSYREYHDIVFAFAYGINVLIITCYGLFVGIRVLYSINDVSFISITQNAKPIQSSENSNDLIGGIMLSLSLGFILSIGLIIILAKLSHHLVHITILVSAGVSLLSGVIIFTMGYIIGGLFLLLFALCCGLFYLYMKPYLLFASVMLKIACQALEQLPSLFLSTIAVLVYQAIFCLLWLLTVIGTATNESNTIIHANGVSYHLDECSTYSYSKTYIVGDTTLSCEKGTCYACICDNTAIASSSKACMHERIYTTTYFFLLLSLFWTFAICANIVHCTVSASTARWWTNANPPTQAVVWNSFKASLTTSFGSICMGSLLVAIIRTLRAIVSFSKSQLEKLKLTSSLASCCQMMILRLMISLLTIVDMMVEYFNMYAFCFVAIYGYNFIDSSKAAISLFKDRGWNAIINDDIISYLFFIAHVLVGVICLLITLAYASSKHISSVNVTLLLILAYNAGHFMCSVTTMLTSSAVATIYVCFAEKPDFFRVTHPELYDELVTAWKAFYPNTLPVDDRKNDGGSYIPPHLINAGSKQGNAYQPVFSGVDDDIESPISNPRYVQPSTLSPSNAGSGKKGVIISGKFGQSQTPYGSARTQPASNLPPPSMMYGDNQPSLDTNSNTDMLTRMVTGAREHTTRIVDQVAMYMNPPVATRDHHFTRTSMIESTSSISSSMLMSANMAVEPPSIYDNADESTMF